MGAAKIAGSGLPTATGEAELASLRHAKAPAMRVVKRREKQEIRNKK